MYNFFLVSILIIFLCFILNSLIKIIKLLRGCLRTLNRIEAILTPESMAEVVEFYIEKNGQLIKVTDMNLKVTEQVKLNVVFKDAKGNLAAVEGAPVWSATAPALVTLIPAEDGMSCMVKPVGQVGGLQVQCKADADLGEGVKEIMGFMDFALMVGEASVVELAAEEPTVQE